MTSNYLEKTSRLVAWRINNLDKIGDDHVISKEFFIGEWYWILECFKLKEKIRLILKPIDKGKLAYPIASLDIHLICPNGSPIITYQKSLRDVECTYEDDEFTYNDDCYCFKKDVSELHGSTSVTFGLEFLDLKINSANDDEFYSIWHEEYAKANPTNESLSKMLSESICTDIVINARDGSIKAHRAILAANSTVFKVMFSGNYKENVESTVNIDDMSIGACTAMLKFFYGKKTSKQLRAHCEETILAAEKYDNVHLKKACEASLCEDVDTENVFQRLMCAHKFDFPELTNICMFYLLQMRMISALQDEYNTFIREADPELVVLVSGAVIKAYLAT